MLYSQGWGQSRTNTHWIITDYIHNHHFKLMGNCWETCTLNGVITSDHKPDTYLHQKMFDNSQMSRRGHFSSARQATEKIKNTVLLVKITFSILASLFKSHFYESPEKGKKYFNLEAEFLAKSLPCILYYSLFSLQNLSQRKQLCSDFFAEQVSEQVCIYIHIHTYS